VAVPQGLVVGAPARKAAGREAALEHGPAVGANGPEPRTEGTSGGACCGDLLAQVCHFIGKEILGPERDRVGVTQQVASHRIRGQRKESDCFSG
jgi:hypothetical protein